MAAAPGFEPDDAFTQCVSKCHQEITERHRSACIEAFLTQPEGHTGVMSTERTRAMGASARPKIPRTRLRYQHVDPESIAIAKAIVKRAAPEPGAPVHSEEQCDMNELDMTRFLLDFSESPFETPGGSPSLSSRYSTSVGSSSVGSLSSVKIIGGPGAHAADVHRKASGSSTSSSCDSTKRVLMQCLKEFDSELSLLHQEQHQETIGAFPHLHGQASDSSLASSSSGSSGLSSLSSSSLLSTKLAKLDYGNYYAANMQPMNGLNECRMNLEQCEQSQHSLFLLDGVLLLTLVSLSLVGVLCIICLCAVIIARYIPFNQRKSGHVTYQNADTEIENL